MANWYKAFDGKLVNLEISGYIGISELARLDNYQVIGYGYAPAMLSPECKTRAEAQAYLDQIEKFIKITNGPLEK